MTNVVNMPSEDRRFDEASQWIARLDRHLSEREQRDLERWLDSDPKNQGLLLEMAKLWDKMDSLARLAALFPERPRRARRAPGYAAVAAVAASILAFVSSWMLIGDYDPPKVPVISTFSLHDVVFDTAIGERRTIDLSDGSRLTLNTNSLVRVDYGPEHRILKLERGEMYLRVAKDRTRPLSVIAAGRIVQAVGTEFNIEITDDQRIELVVTEGLVRVGAQKAQTNPDSGASGVDLPSEYVAVTAGETLVLNDAKADVTMITADDIEVRLSWRSGNLVFRGEPLEEAVKEIGRYTSVEFVFLDDDLRKVRVAGRFKAGDVDGLLATLRENFNIVYQRIDDGKVLLDSN